MTVRNSVQALRVAALRDLELGRVDAAIDKARMMLRLSRDVARLGYPISHLVSRSLAGMTCANPGGKTLIQSTLNAKAISVEHCEQLAEIVEGHQAEMHDSLLDMYRMQYVMARIALHHLERSTGEFDPDYVQHELGILGPDHTFRCILALLRAKKGWRLWHADSRPASASRRYRRVTVSEGKAQKDPGVLEPGKVDDP